MREDVVVVAVALEEEEVVDTEVAEAEATVAAVEAVDTEVEEVRLRSF